MTPRPKLAGWDSLITGSPTTTAPTTGTVGGGTQITVTTPTVPAAAPQVIPQAAAQDTPATHRYQMYLDDPSDRFLRDVAVMAVNRGYPEVTRSKVVRLALAQLRSTATAEQVLQLLRRTP